MHIRAALSSFEGQRRVPYINVLVQAIKNLYNIVSRYISPLHRSARSDSDVEIRGNIHISPYRRIEASAVSRICGYSAHFGRQRCPGTSRMFCRPDRPNKAKKGLHHRATGKVAHVRAPGYPAWGHGLETSDFACPGRNGAAHRGDTAPEPMARASE